MAKTPTLWCPDCDPASFLVFPGSNQAQDQDRAYRRRMIKCTIKINIKFRGSAWILIKHLTWRIHFIVLSKSICLLTQWLLLLLLLYHDVTWMEFVPDAFLQKSDWAKNLDGWMNLEKKKKSKHILHLNKWWKIDEWMDGLMDDGYVDVWIDGCMCGWMMDRWTNQQGVEVVYSRCWLLGVL